jgi:uncharacterized membrane protein
MNKKIKLIDIKETPGGKNKVELKNGKFNEKEKDIDCEIKIYDDKNNLIESSDKLQKIKDKLTLHITLYIYPDSWKEKLENGDVTYYLDNIKERSEYLRCKNEAIFQYIYENFSSISNPEGKVIEYSTLPRVKCVIAKENEKLDIKIRNENVSGPDTIKISVPKEIKMFIEFGKNDTVEADEIITFPSPSKPGEPFWTWGKIFLVGLVVLIIVALLYFYRKKIWSWIKREDKSKKKEQVEIF